MTRLRSALHTLLHSHPLAAYREVRATGQGPARFVRLCRGWSA